MFCHAVVRVEKRIRRAVCGALALEIRMTEAILNLIRLDD
jgi:hypothetical protein